MTFSCGEDTNCIALSFDGATLTATLVISPADGNAALCTEDGLFVPGGALAEGVLPSDPVNGQQAVFVASNTEGVLWHLFYRADSPSLYKWEWLGGSELRNKVTALENFTGAAPAGYINLPGETVGPEVTTPLEGDYIVRIEALLDGAEEGTQTSAAPKIGGVAADFDNAIANYTDRYISAARTVRLNGVNAGTLIRLQYHKASADTAHVGHRLISIRPVRVKEV